MYVLLCRQVLIGIFVLWHLLEIPLPDFWFAGDGHLLELFGFVPAVSKILRGTNEFIPTVALPGGSGAAAVQTESWGTKGEKFKSPGQEI